MADGKEPFGLWFRALKDVRAKAAILKRIERLEAGNFGACKPCREGVCELVIDLGPGYRVYYGILGKEIVLLLCAGDKSTQQTDIAKAIEYLMDFKERSK
ncbi:type II toxin-antitoxin system RelE/ParE family toxin [Fundidesulfovibrio putealis]|uniref:type II toxin-antitoxin system RelE/ParE family toxin n=1 Tax=Fundidesulfovibrio putealis TaxID=270496 RepID=UPI0012EBB7B4|nr:type II toxin-antitoxin system RelE/ParE family toxin [Fundidesulfovibrio putealis]